MDLTSFTSFFYNILPGIYIWVFLNSDVKKQLLEHFSLDSSSNLALIILISLSLLLGFIFQGLTKIVRELFFDVFIVKNVIADNSKGKSNLWKKARGIISDRGLVLKGHDKENVQIFYLMDNYLNAAKSNPLPLHFSARTSLWANLFWSNIVLFFCPAEFINKCYILIFFLLVIVVAWLNFKAQQDTILKSFLMHEVNYDKLSKK